MINRTTSSKGEETTSVHEAARASGTMFLMPGVALALGAA